MRMQPITLRLGAHEWRVRPLTLKQIQEIEPLLLAADQSAGRAIATAIEIIAVALTRDHLEAAQNLAAIEASAQEVGAAMSAVLQLGGFVAANDAQETEQGEEMAGADGISASSTPA